MGLLAIAGVIVIVIGVLGLLGVLAFGVPLSAVIILLGIVLIVVDRRGAGRL